MAEISDDSLISTHPSTSGLQIALHPLALLTISDYITRHTLRKQTGPMVGALLGTQEGRDIAIEHAYEIITLVDKDQVRIDEEWFDNKLKLFKETHPTLDLLGWFTTTTSPTFAPSLYMVPIHQKMLNYNESAIILCLNPAPNASAGGGGKLPLGIYESIIETEDAAAAGSVESMLKLRFVPLKYTIETGEAEMIGVDFVAKGGFGNATAESSGLEGTAEGKVFPKDAKKIKLAGEFAEMIKEKGKQRERGERGERAGEETEDKLNVGTQNDELLANLTAKANAIRMLHSRIRLLTNYLSDPPHKKPNHQLLRALKSLTHSRLPLLTPADAGAFRQEQLAEQSDVHLVALLGVLTRSIEEARGVGKKFAGIEATNKANMRMGGSGAAGEPAVWENYGPPKDPTRRGRRENSSGGGSAPFGNYPSNF
jgi:COP9 signalosome complex subunit 6